MKKRIGICLAALLVLSAPATAFAAYSSAGVGEEPLGPGAEISVQASYIYVPDSSVDEAEPDENGSYIAEVEGDNGDKKEVRIDIETSLPDGLHLIVHLIPASDTIPHEWFQNVLQEYGTTAVPYEVYFTDHNGAYVTASIIMTITFSIPDGYIKPAVYYVGTDGFAVKMDTAVDFDSKTISFTTSHNSYYVVVDENNHFPVHEHSYGDWMDTGDGEHHLRACSCGDREMEGHIWNRGEVTKEATGKEEGIKTYTCTACGAIKEEQIPKHKEAVSPVTGDSGSSLQWVILLFISGGGLIGLTICGRKYC